MIEPMKQYHFDRDDFVKVFEEVFGDDLESFLDGTLGDSEQFFSYKVDGFKCFMVESTEFYIVDLETGVLINWYKHLGRTNTCSREDFTLEDLREMLTRLYNELKS